VKKCKADMPVGTKCVMVNCAEAELHKGKVWETRSEPWQLGHGAWVVLLEGYCGGFLVDKLALEEDGR